MIDPKYEEEVSGCTASVGLISESKIYIVSHQIRSQWALSHSQLRRMLEILDQYSV